MAGGEFKRSFKKREVIFSEGDRGETAYLIREGSVSLTKRTDDGKVILAAIGKGMIFGEMALLDGRPRMATAVATEDTICSLIGPEHFENRLDALEPGMRKVFDEMLKYVRETLPWDIRKEKASLKGETGRDAEMRPILKPPSTMLPAALVDPALDALYKLLSYYVQRRLPEQPPS